MTNDWFTIMIAGTHPLILTNAVLLPEGAFQFTVLPRVPHERLRGGDPESSHG